jgi:hypothetical protein
MTATVLIIAAFSSALLVDDNDPPELGAVRAAAPKALPLILKSTGDYPESRDCFSCHHQAVPVLALSPVHCEGAGVRRPNNVDQRSGGAHRGGPPGGT